MNGVSLSLPSALPARPAHGPTRPTLQTDMPAPTALSRDESAHIARTFPARPAVAQRLYGPSREIHTPARLGGTLDLSA